VLRKLVSMISPEAGGVVAPVAAVREVEAAMTVAEAEGSEMIAVAVVVADSL
jgi:hypothetical protein